MNRINELEEHLNVTGATNSSNVDYIAQLEAEVSRLKSFENDYVAFQERVNEFDRNVVFNDKAPEIEEYKTFYEGISPENAEVIYRQVLEQYEHSETIKSQKVWSIMLAELL